MTDSMKTAMEASFAEQQRDRRDHAVCHSIAHKMGETYKGAPIPLDEYELLCLIDEVAMKAAYDGIQQERALHKGEMALLNRWMEVQVETGMMKPSPPLVVPISDER